MSGEISFALSQSEKFLRGILVLGKRNPTQLIPSGPMPLIKQAESVRSVQPAAVECRQKPWGSSDFHLWLRPSPDWRKLEVSGDRVTSV